MLLNCQTAFAKKGLDVMSPCLRLLLSLCLLLVALPAWAGEVRLSVAGSMTDVVKSLTNDFRRQHPEARFVLNIASSGTLAKQIASGAPTDLFVSADPKWMDFLAGKGLITSASVRIVAHNSLVVVGRPGSAVRTLADLSKLPRIAMGSPASVPAGKYAEQALTGAGLYQGMKNGQKLVLTKDVRQALMYAERGEVDAAFVFCTDALLAKKAALLLKIPQELYSRVSYPAGLTTMGTANDEARGFMDYLGSPEAVNIFSSHGFVVD
jgi:molybdate transport system substrate-binding protein